MDWFLCRLIPVFEEKGLQDLCIWEKFFTSGCAGKLGSLINLISEKALARAKVENRFDLPQAMMFLSRQRVPDVDMLLVESSDRVLEARPFN